MPNVVPNQATASLRSVTLRVTLPDGVTPAPISTFTPDAVKATTAALGTADLPTAIARVQTAGAAGNLKTLTLVHDGTGTVTISTVGNAVMAHYQSAVNTAAQLATALNTVGLELVSGTFTGSTVLQNADAVGPVSFSGGWDVAIQVRHSGVTQYALAAGAWTNATDPSGASIDGEWEYVFSQAETNVVAGELVVRVVRAGVIAELVVSVPMQQTVEVSSIDAAAVQQIFDGSAAIEGSYTPGDLLRLMASILAGKVSGFDTGLLIYRSLDDSKTRWTVQTAAAGRTSITPGTLT
jgi:hypothetical protein